MKLNNVIKHLGGLTSYANSICRMVETQEYAATTSLVDDLEEQAILEQILDDFKPNYADDTQDLHYLISTPFRYPPLKYGSRFGAITEPSYFYASEAVQTCLAEAAFYRFYLIDGTESPFPKMIQSEHSLFFVRVLSNSTLDLTQISDAKIQNQLTDPGSYSFTQQVGLQARKDCADLLRYFSARSQEQGINVAIDNHTIIQSEKPEDKVEYICQLDPKTGILRFSEPRAFPIMFTREQFLVDGELPLLG
ncbi:RES family NAD+ phosphorylase [Paraglaciecola sp. MB-3u-78]|uniref:RES family NAD+ phosphorylase n=1 Tax=Paraglaciecola sp. MB-3u-78 TaxID=2058332 RepID=UPI000C3245DD|nr:RES family NAD+ phosphorylase [Paraglaciecola sp. MB-3u-78]PKG99720.1 RES domain-containing protein [Paraglaciecola sp. MB-3u-78]